MPTELKERLQRAKGKKEWGKFLGELLEEASRGLRERAFSRLVQLLEPDELEMIMKSRIEFRRDFKLR